MRKEVTEISLSKVRTINMKGARAPRTIGIVRLVYMRFALLGMRSKRRN